MRAKFLSVLLLVGAGLVAPVQMVWAQGAVIGPTDAATPTPAPTAPTFGPAGKESERSIGEWLMRMHEASRKRAYVGTFVVTSEANLASARIWHVCDGDQQMERVDTLTGPPRSTFRRNDQVVTFLPDAKVARIEKRESLGLFPNLLNATDSSIPEFYAARQVGSDRVAGFEADIVQLKPKDQMRYGYRIWSEKKSGLVIKLQTLDLDGRVLEQAAFSELQLDAPVRMDKLVQMMGKTAGYKTEKLEVMPTTAAAEGWSLKAPIAGFKSMSCLKRPVAGGGVQPGTIQWIFSDGLASVSLFLEAFDTQRHVREGLVSMGATQSLTQRLNDWWLTAVGEVPPQTLKAFVLALERKK